MTRDFRDSSTVFVYGTLQPEQPNFRAVADHVRSLGRARLEDYRLWALPQGYPTILPGPGTVVGTLLGLDDEGLARKIMNRIEGYSPDDDQSLYRPRPVDIQHEDGRRLESFAYVMNRRRHELVRRRGTLVEHGNWIQWSTDCER